MSVKVYTLHLLDGYFLEQDMGGDLGKNIIMAVPKSEYEKLEARCKDLEKQEYDSIIFRLNAAKKEEELSDKIKELKAEIFFLNVPDMIKQTENLKQLILLSESNRILKAKLEKIETAYSIRASDVWLKHNMSPYDYLCKVISEELDSIE